MKQNNIFKKLGILTLTFLFMLSVSNALTIQMGQDPNLFDYNKASKGNYLSNFYLANTNNEETLEGNETLQYDYRLSLSQLTQPFYIIIDNLEENTTYDISYSNDLTQSQVINTFNTTLEEQGKYYYKFTPSSAGEDSIIYIDNLNNVSAGEEPIFFIAYQEEKPQGFSYVVENFINFFVDVLEINLSIWKLLFYLVVFIISTAIVFFIWSMAFLVFKYVQRIKDHGRDRPTRRIEKEE